MITASLLKNVRNQSVRLPKELEFSGVNEVELRKEGNSIIITPLRKSRGIFADILEDDQDYLSERNDIVEGGRVIFNE